LKNSKQK
jgi:hypothetical protein